MIVEAMFSVSLLFQTEKLCAPLETSQAASLGCQFLARLVQEPVMNIVNVAKTEGAARSPSVVITSNTVYRSLTANYWSQVCTSPSKLAFTLTLGL